jgi:hypothetical protein
MRSVDMPPTSTDGDVKDFEVGPRARMGLDVLTPEDRRTIEEAIRSKEDFLARISDPSQVFLLRPGSRYYALKITPSLRLIYTRDGDRIYVEDLMNQGMIDLLLSPGNDETGSRSGKRSAPNRTRRRASRAGAE